MNTHELREHAKKHWGTIKTKLLENKYNPSPVRRKEISKPMVGVDFISRRKFLGFSFYFAKSRVKIRIHEKSIKRFKEKAKFYTNRNKGISMEYRILKLNQITRGWINYYEIANARRKLMEMDGWIRRRLTSCI